MIINDYEFLILHHMKERDLKNGMSNAISNRHKKKNTRQKSRSIRPIALCIRSLSVFLLRLSERLEGNRNAFHHVISTH